VLTDLELRRSIVKKFHDTVVMGHPKQFKIIEAIQKYYWWPGMHTFIMNYITGCAVCQQNKVNTHLITPPLILIKSAGSRPFAMLTMDFITDLPISSGMDSMLMVVDHRLMKGIVLIPCTKTFGTLETTNALLRNIYRRFGLLDVIISNRGPQFGSHTFREMGKLLGINLCMSTAYHPQTDRETEHMNQELETYLQIYCGNNPTGWEPLTPILEFTHNNHVYKTMKQTPFFLMGGYEIKPFSLPFGETTVPSVEQ
jgi:hypothetical protein